MNDCGEKRVLLHRTTGTIREKVLILQGLSQAPAHSFGTRKSV